MPRKKDPIERMAIALEEFVGLQKEALEKVKLLLPQATQATSLGVSRGGALPALSAPLSERPPDGDREEAIEEILNLIDNEITETGPQLLRSAMKEAMLDSGRTTEEIKEIEKKLKKMPEKRLKRKKGCLFLEIGDGITDPIEELYIKV